VLPVQFAQVTVNAQEVISIQKVIGQQQQLLLSLKHIYWLLMALTNYFSMEFAVVDRLFVVVVEFDFVSKPNEFPLFHSEFQHHVNLPMVVLTANLLVETYCL
jgi:hypothetical protein